jgi:hypothetical protein
MTIHWNPSALTVAELERKELAVTPRNAGQIPLRGCES